MAFEGRFADQVALVTGGSSGLGRAVAQRLAAEGATVAIGDLRAEPREGGEPTHEAIGSAGGTAVHYELDVTSEDAVQDMFTNAVDELGGLDVVICAAGIIGPEGDSREIEFEDFKRVFEVNVNGVWLCNQAALRHMVPAKAGRIVNFASNYGLIGSVQLATYCASKAAVINITKSLAVEFGQHGININAICPGATATEINAHMRSRDDIDQLFQARTPIRIGDEGRYVGIPEEIASAVLFMASDEFSFGTGTAFVVDGGWVAA
ncbi:MAG: SDR family NAD(P)-dependent oxidoreductase [Solirubrobacterales bacterium]